MGPFLFRAHPLKHDRLVPLANWQTIPDVQFGGNSRRSITADAERVEGLSTEQLRGTSPTIIALGTGCAEAAQMADPVHRAK